jgi:hypothetical protein
VPHKYKKNHIVDVLAVPRSALWHVLVDSRMVQNLARTVRGQPSRTSTMFAVSRAGFCSPYRCIVNVGQ